MTIEFTVWGTSQPAGSKKAFYVEKIKRAVITDDCKKSRGWKHIVSAAAANAYRGPLLEGPLFVQMVFYRTRPKGHICQSKKNFGKVRPSAPPFPTGRPDVLKLARAAEDAMTKIIWRDDSQIVTEVLAKRYGDQDRVDITITTIEDGDIADGSSFDR